MAKERPPFEFDKPNEHTPVTQARCVGYGDDSDVGEELDKINESVRPRKGSNKYYVCDPSGHVIAVFDENGFKSTAIGLVKSGNSKGRLISGSDDGFSICDGNGNLLANFDSHGLNVSQVNLPWGNKLTNIMQIFRGSTLVKTDYSNALYFTDANGYVFMSITEVDGEYVFDYVGKGVSPSPSPTPSPSGDGNAINEWEGKRIAFYGDSVTAICNGDFTYPYTSSQIDSSWGNRIANHLKFAKCYGRGIGSQKFSWANTSGSVSWLNPSGNLIARNDSFNYDNFDGVSYPSGVTAAMEANGTAIRVRGCGCSWLRIIKTFPAEIKDTIDVVSIMYHNDAGAASTEAEWVANDVTDTEWAASEYYITYGGDYNIDTVRGGIASIIMKLQAWMPNAVLILCTPISGNGTANQRDMTLSSDRNMIRLADDVMAMSKRLHIPCIDVNRNDGINGINRISYIYDSIHPYTVNGKKMVARAIIGGLKTILPNF